MADARIDIIKTAMQDALVESGNPDIQIPAFDEKEIKAIGFALKVFDKLLPLMIKTVRAEWDKQKEAELSVARSNSALMQAASPK